jgi:integrase
MPRDKRWRPATIKAGTFASVVGAYLASDKFAKLAVMTQYNYRRLLDIARRPDVLGDVRVDRLRPALVQAFLDGLSSTPGTAKNAKVALNAVQRWALVRDLVSHPFTTGTEVAACDGGHVPWSDAQVALAVQHARPHLARAIMLGAQTGQRRSDLVKMRWADLEKVNGRLGINVVQQKTGLDLWIPFTQDFEREIMTWGPPRPAPILLKRNGQPFKAHELSDQWRFERNTNPALAPLKEAGLDLHGLRSTAVVRLRRAGATTGQIKDMVGMSEQMVNRYCRKSVQRENAMAAIAFIDKPSNVVPLKREGTG